MQIYKLFGIIPNKKYVFLQKKTVGIDPTVSYLKQKKLPTNKNWFYDVAGYLGIFFQSPGTIAKPVFSIRHINSEAMALFDQLLS